MKKIILGFSIASMVVIIIYLIFDYYTFRSLINSILVDDKTTIFEKVNVLNFLHGYTKAFVISLVGLFLCLIGVNLIYNNVGSTNLTTEAKGIKLDLQTNSAGLIIIALGCLLLLGTLIFRSHSSIEISQGDRKEHSNYYGGKD